MIPAGENEQCIAFNFVNQPVLFVHSSGPDISVRYKLKKLPDLTGWQIINVFSISLLH